MKKNVFALLVLGGMTLTACSSSSAGLSFDEGYQTFHYKGKDYAISKVEVTEDSIQRTEAKFMEWPVVKDNGSVKETVSLNNLYVTSSHDWVIGVQDSYYKVEAEKAVAKVNRINYQEVLNQVNEQK
ncbi:TPA: NisI/SpaI family lantibiotic immunity lipoprotein [Streptococcus suis]|nr:NisI/SpaI family lantibiotic immunity lipoprotein [Streptococcus suis]HEP1828621.1 NisI/SpaI family lantibiotic immunity lipoprotein [Streptococcus suis]